jgi:hypothetical protein
LPVYWRSVDENIEVATIEYVRDHPVGQASLKTVQKRAFPDSRMSLKLRQEMEQRPAFFRRMSGMSLLAK